MQLTHVHGRLNLFARGGEAQTNSSQENRHPECVWSRRVSLASLVSKAEADAANRVLLVAATHVLACEGTEVV